MANFGENDPVVAEFGADDPPLTLPEKRDFAERNAIAFQLGISPDEVDVRSGADFLDRLDFSFSDNDAEIFKKFHAKYPQGVIRRVNVPERLEELEPRPRLGEKEPQKVHAHVVWKGPRLVFKFNKNDPEEKFKTVEDYGRVSIGDIADIVGPTAKATPGIAASLAAPPGAIAQALAFGVGTAGGHFAKEGVEEMRGFQLQPLGEVATEAGAEGFAAAAPAFGLGLARNLINTATGRGLLSIAPEEQLAMQRIAESGLPLRPLTAPQLAPEHKILQRLSRQASSTSHYSQEELRLQQISATQAMRSLEKRTATQIGKPLQQITEKSFREKYFNLLRDRFVTPERGGRALQEGAKDFVSGSREVVRRLYSAADDAAATERPIFDLRPALSQADEIEKSVRALTYGPDPQAVNVAAAPQGELLEVIRDLRNIAQTQVDYEAVKQLRTRLYDMIDNQPWNWDFNKFQARKLYGALTQVLEQPANPAPRFRAAFQAANQAARERFDILERPTLQKIVRSDQPALLAENFASPGQLTEEVFSALKQYSPEKLTRFRQAGQLKLLQSKDGALNAINDFIRRDPEGFSRLVPSAERKQLLEIARKVDSLNTERAVTLLNRQTRASQFVSELIRNQDAAGVEQAIRFVGGVGTRGHKLLRAGTLEHAISESIEMGEKGFMTVNKDKLKTVVEGFKRSGVWEKLLTKEDRTKLAALEDYTRLLSVGADAGTSLEAAGAISQMKHPRTFLAGLHQLSVNALMARFLISPKATKLLVGSGKQRDFNTLRRFGTFVTTIADDLEAGEQGPGPLLPSE